VRFSIRKLLFAVVVLAVAVGLFMQFRPRPLAVDASTVEPGALEVTLEADGETRIRDRYTITAPVAGVLSRVELHAGDAIEPGQVVARIAPVLLDPTALEQAKLAHQAAAARVEQARSAVSAAETVLERARDKHRQIEELHQTNDRVAPKRLVDDAWAEVQLRESELDEAEKALAVVRFDYQRARAAIPRRQWTEDLESSALADEPAPPAESDEDETLLTSPLKAPGRVLQVIQQGPATVPLATPIMEIGDVTTIEAVIDLLTTDAVKIAPGATVKLEGIGGKTLTGTVDRVDPKAFTKLSALGVEEKRVNVFVKLDGAASEAIDLGDGYAVQATLLVSRRENVLLAPIGALFRPGQDWAVYIIENERARLRTVKLGERNDEFAHVTDGLSPGDLVVLHPSDALKPGAWVRPQTLPSPTPRRPESAAASVSRLPNSE
jgi:HlyD family secretion protein